MDFPEPIPPSGRPAACRSGPRGPGSPTRRGPRAASGPRGSPRARPRRASPPPLRPRRPAPPPRPPRPRLRDRCRRLRAPRLDRFLHLGGRGLTGASAGASSTAGDVVSSAVSADADTSASASMAASVTDAPPRERSPPRRMSPRPPRRRRGWPAAPRVGPVPSRARRPRPAGGLLLDLDLGGTRLVRHLPHRQADPAAWDIDVDHLRADLVTDRQHRLRCVDVLVAELGDVDQSFDARRHADERAERHELRDLPLDDLAGLVPPLELLPGVLLRRLERQRHALALEVDIEDLDLDLLADGDDLAGMIHVLPRQLGDVHEPVHAAQVDERAEVDDGADGPLAALALRESLEELLASLGLRLLQERAARQHDVVAVAVELDDLRLEVLTDERVQVADATKVDERCRQEPTQADVQDQPALDDLDDRDR